MARVSSPLTVLAPQQSRGPIGGLGEAAVSGLSGALQVLGQQKLQHLQDAQQKFSSYKAGKAYGLTDEESRLFSDVPQEMQADFIGYIDRLRAHRRNQITGDLNEYNNFCCKLSLL